MEFMGNVIKPGENTATLKWIPTDVALPKEFGYKLLSFHDSDGYFICIGRYSPETNNWYSDSGYQINVTVDDTIEAWCDLLLPYYDEDSPWGDIYKDVYDEYVEDYKYDFGGVKVN